MGKGTSGREMEGAERQRDAKCERERRERRGELEVGGKWM